MTRASAGKLYLPPATQSTNEAVHLGHIIGPSSQSKHAVRILSDFNRRVNVLMSTFIGLHIQQ